MLFLDPGVGFPQSGGDILFGRTAPGTPRDFSEACRGRSDSELSVPVPGIAEGPGRQMARRAVRSPRSPFLLVGVRFTPAW